MQITIRKLIKEFDTSIDPQHTPVESLMIVPTKSLYLDDI